MKTLLKLYESFDTDNKRKQKLEMYKLAVQYFGITQAKEILGKHNVENLHNEISIRSNEVDNTIKSWVNEKPERKPSARKLKNSIQQLEKSADKSNKDIAKRLREIFYKYENAS